ncbi:LysM peptidoglycan-binding domain-containing protein, partial [Jiangella rhizosphaerae]
MIGSSTPRAVMRGLAALLGLAALVVGVPAVLWAAGGSPWPSEWPSPSDIRSAAVSPDDGTLFLAVLIVAGWLGWGTFVLSLVVEVPAALRGRPAPRLPGLRAQQRLVAGLVAAVAATGAGGQVAAAPSVSPEPWEPAPPVTTNLLDAHQHGGAYVVVDGDTLWEIAGTQLDDPLRYPEIVAASSATVQPDGRRLTDPDLIVPGWTLTLPGADDAVGGLPDTGGPPAGSRDIEPVSAGADPGHGGADPGHGGAAGSGSEDERRPGTDDGEVLRTAGGVGAVLAAALVGVLATRRAREQRRRRPGERLDAGSPSDQRTETELRQAADPVAVEVVDRVLRGLSARLARAGRGLPPLRAVRLTRRTLELYLAAPAELPPPFAGTAHGGVWTVPLDEATDDDPGVPAPYPSLVTLGHDHDDALVLLDLEQVGTLVLDGPPELVRSALTAVAAELATSAWADDLRVTLVGAPALADLDLLDTGRVRHVTDVEQLLDELTVRVADDRLLLATAGVSGLGAARVTQVADAAWTPEIVVIAEPLPAAQWDRLEALIVTAPRVAVAAVVGSGEPNGAPARGHRLRGRVSHSGGGTWVLRLDGPPERPVAVLDPLGVPIRPQLLDEETRGRVLRLLGATAGSKGAVADDSCARPAGPVGRNRVERGSGAANGSLPASLADRPSVVGAAPPYAATGGEPAGRAADRPTPG